MKAEDLSLTIMVLTEMKAEQNKLAEETNSFAKSERHYNNAHYIDDVIMLVKSKLMLGNDRH